MIRATTGGVLRSYRYNLMNSFITSNKARDTVLSQRNFNTFAEDPASAAKAFRLRKSRMTVKSQYDICNDTYFKFQTAWQCLESVSLIVDNETSEYLSTIKGTNLTMLNDPEGDARTQLAKALDQISQSVVQTMNQKYGDNFIFAGADGHNVPFEIKDDGKLYYRGVPVDAAEPKRFTYDGGTDTGAGNNANYVTVKDAEGTEYYVSAYSKTISLSKYRDAERDAEIDPDNFTVPEVLRDDNGDPIMVKDKEGNDCYILAESAKLMTDEDVKKAQSDYEKLKYLKNEKLYVDIGLGFQENEDGQLIASSAFNAALIGIDFFGSGLDDDGDPINIYSLVQRMKEIANSVPEDGRWDEETYDEFFQLVGKMEDSAERFHTEFVNMDAGTSKLKSNLSLLEDNFYNLQEQYANLEDVDMADAITSFVWAQYCYNAALKVGNSVLSESLMDYLRT